jgi:hypothetical protein
MRITNNKELELAILELKEKEAIEKKALIDHFHSVVENLSPGKLIKNAFTDLTDSSELTDTAIGLAAGGIFERLITGRSPGLIKKTIGGLLSVAVTNIAIKNAGYIKTACSHLLEQAVSFFQDLNKSDL